MPSSPQLNDKSYISYKNISGRLISISQRPQQADGTRFGDWEMDTMLAPYKNKILTLTTDNGTEFAEHEKISKSLHGKKAISKILINL